MEDIPAKPVRCPPGITFSDVSRPRQCEQVPAALGLGNVYYPLQPLELLTHVHRLHAQVIPQVCVQLTYRRHGLRLLSLHTRRVYPAPCPLAASASLRSSLHLHYSKVFGSLSGLGYVSLMYWYRSWRTDAFCLFSSLARPMFTCAVVAEVERNENWFSFPR